MQAFYNILPVLITGGCGFIGSHLAHKLVDLGAQVTIIDDLSTGSLENIKDIRSQITFIQASITDFDACMQAAHNNKIIFHLAACVSVPQSLENPAQCNAVNVQGTFNILEAARLNGIDRFIFSSSSAIYGLRSDCVHETDLPNPESPYGYSKLLGELYCQQYAKNFGINAVIMRYFNVWGSRQNPNGAYAAVVAKFMHCMENNLPITIYGDGLQTRDFVPVEDVVKANLVLGMLAPTIVGQIYNIGTGTSITLLTLIEQLKIQFPQFNAGVEFKPTRSGDIKYSQADCSKFLRLLE